MALPRRTYRQPEVEPGRVRSTSGAMRRGRGTAARRREAARRRRFTVLVLIPILLMLGSIYLHTVSGNLQERVAGLEERLTRVRGEGEELDVRVARLSQAERVRSLARKESRMVDPDTADLRVYDGTGEDGNAHEAQRQREEAR